MKVRITARHFDLTDDLKQFGEDRVGTLTRYFDKFIDLHLKLDVEKYRHAADLNATVYGNVLTCSADSNDMYAAIDEVVNKMETQVKKYKSRLQDKDQRSVARAKTPRTSPSEEAEMDEDDFGVE